MKDADLYSLRFFDDLGVWPQLLRLKNGVTLVVYGRPGLYVRATADLAGLRWAHRVTVAPPGAIGTEIQGVSHPVRANPSGEQQSATGRRGGLAAVDGRTVGSDGMR